MFKTIVIASFAVLVLGINTFAQRPTPGAMGGGLLGGTGSTTTTPAVTPGVSMTNLYQNGGGWYGRVTAYNGSHFTLEVNDGSVLKTWGNSCSYTQDRTGVLCSFVHFYNGKAAYSGQSLIFNDGRVYLRWMYQLQGNQSVWNDSGWNAFTPR